MIISGGGQTHTTINTFEGLICGGFFHTDPDSKICNVIDETGKSEIARVDSVYLEKQAKINKRWKQMKMKHEMEAERANLRHQWNKKKALRKIYAQIAPKFVHFHSVFGKKEKSQKFVESTWKKPKFGYYQRKR